MNQSKTPPDASMTPFELTMHDDTRIDNYYWMRLTDEQKNMANIVAATGDLDPEAAEALYNQALPV